MPDEVTELNIARHLIERLKENGLNDEEVAASVFIFNVLNDVAASLLEHRFPARIQARAEAVLKGAFTLSLGASMLEDEVTISEKP